MEYVNTPYGKVFFKESVSSDGRPYRLLSISKNLQLPSKYITSRGDCWHWVYKFIYTDNDEIFGFEFDYYDRYLKKI